MGPARRPSAMIAWRRRTASRAVSLVLLVALAGCGGGGAPSESPQASIDPVGTWQLVDGHGVGGPVQLVDGWPITLTVSGEAFSGTAACNGYGGRFEPRPQGGVTIVELGATAMACVEPGVGEAEAAFLGAMQAVQQVGGTDELLVLTGPGTELRFERAPVAPTAEVMGTVWLLESLVTDDVAAAPLGDRATLEIREDGTLSGSTGCRTFAGSWVERGTQIVTTTLAMDDSECPADLAEQDGHVVTVIGDGFVPIVDGDQLTLSDAGGLGLVYRADTR